MPSEPTPPASPTSSPTHDYEQIAARAEHVRPREARRAQVVARPCAPLTAHPRPARAHREPEPEPQGPGGEVELAFALKAHPQVVKSVGLYKVVGETVHAVVGGDIPLVS